MNAPVGDELIERNPGDLSANGIESAHYDDAGSVVDDDINAGRFFKRANVATFAADDATLHFIAGDVDRARRCLSSMSGGKSLDRRQQDFAGLYICDCSDFLLLLHDQLALLVGQLLIEPFEQATFGFFRTEAADLMERLPLCI